MQIPIEPACYVWAQAGTEASNSQCPPQPFIDDVLWLDSFFSWNKNCRVPMTTELQAAVSRLFPYETAEASGRMGPAKELIGLITRMIDRIRCRPNLEYLDLTAIYPLEDIIARKSAVYHDDDIWLSWCDLISQCLQSAAERGSPSLDAFASTLSSCVHDHRSDIDRRFSVRWHRRSESSLPNGTVDPAAMKAMMSRWQQNKRSLVWENSGHQPPLDVKRLITRVVGDCEGIVLRFGSTYFNPSMPSRCSVLGGGTDKDHLHQLALSISDGRTTIRGVLYTTASTIEEQAAALTYVGNSLKQKCQDANFPCDL